MTIASAIAAKQQQVDAAYTAANGKGATLPTIQDLSNLAATIGTISSGYAELPRYEVSNGTATYKTSFTANDFAGIITADSQAFYYAFYNAIMNGILSFPDLTTAGVQAFVHAFDGTNITKVMFNALTTTVPNGTSNGNNFAGAFNNCPYLTEAQFNALVNLRKGGLKEAFISSGITSVSLPVLEYAASGAFERAFERCQAITTMTFPALKEHENAFNDAYAYCMGITDVYFPALETVYNGAFNNMFHYTTQAITLHAPQNMTQTMKDRITNSTFNPGSTNVSVVFDL